VTSFPTSGLKSKAAGERSSSSRDKPTSAMNATNKKLTKKEAKLAEEIAAKKMASLKANADAKARREKLTKRNHVKPKWKQEAEKKIFEEKERRRAQKMLGQMAVAEATAELAIAEARKRHAKVSMKSAKTKFHIESAFVDPTPKKQSGSYNGGSSGGGGGSNVTQSNSRAQARASTSSQPMPGSPRAEFGNVMLGDTRGIVPSPARINVFTSDSSVCPF